MTRMRGVAVIALAASVPLMAGCAGHTGKDASDKAPSAGTPHASAPWSPSSPPPSAIAVTRTPPDISGSAKAFVRLADRTGSEEIPGIRSVKPGTIAVATECAGKGKTVISIGQLATYTVPCTTTPATTYNEIGLSSSKQNIDTTVTASAGVHWGLSVGWRPGTHPPEAGT